MTLPGKHLALKLLLGVVGCSMAWKCGEEKEPDLLENFAKLRQQEQMQAAADTVLAHPFEFRKIFDDAVKTGLRQRFHHRADGAEEQMELALEIAKIYQEKLDDPFLRNEFDFCNGLAGERLGKKLELDSLYHRAYGFQSRLEYDSAQSIYQKSLALCREIGDLRREVDHLVQIQTILYKQDYNQQALQTASGALNIAREIHYRPREAWLLYDIGNARIELGQFREALQSLDTGLEIAETLRDRNCQLSITWRRGIPLWLLGEYPEALKALNQAIELNRGLGGNPVQESRIYIDRGNVYQSMGNYSQAEKDYREAVQLVKSAGEPEEAEAVAVLNLGELRRILGGYESALDSLFKAAELFKALDNPFYRAAALKIAGDVYRDQGLWEPALGQYQLAQQTISEGEKAGARRSKRLQSEILLNIGDVYRENKNPALALESYRQAVNNFYDIEFREGIAHALTRLGNLYREQGDFRKALQNLAAAQPAAAALQNPLLESNAYYAAGLVYRDQEKIGDAEASFGRAIRTVESARGNIEGLEKITYFATIQDMYDEMILLQYRKSDYATAFHFSERSRARSFLESLLSASAKEKAESVQPFPLPEIQASFSEDLQLVEYKLTRDKLLIFVLDKDNLRATESPVSRQRLNDLVSRFRKTIGADDPADFSKKLAQNPAQLYRDELNLAGELYQLLIQPLEKLLSPEKVLCIASDEVLAYLPFAALASPGQYPPVFLIQHYTIGYAPGAAILKYSLDHRKPELEPARLKLFAVANPLGDLPYAEREVNNIAKLFSHPATLAGSEVREEEVLHHLKQEYEVLHFATHAIIDEKSPLYSYLILGRESYLNPQISPDRSIHKALAKDDLLMAYEIFDLLLPQSRLVTLSACKTAAGRLYRGEGVVGLARAFMAAGSSSVITTLWDIDDRFTALLMEEFYANWLQKGMPKARALREAQLEIIREMAQDEQFRFPHPHRWAAFILNGDYW